MFSELRLSQRRLTVSESCKAASASFRVSPSPSRDFLVIFGPSCSALQVNFDLLRGAEGQMELFKQKCPVTGSGVWFLGCLVWDFLSLGQRVCVCVCGVTALVCFMLFSTRSGLFFVLSWLRFSVTHRPRMTASPSAAPTPRFSFRHVTASTCDGRQSVRVGVS